MTEADLIRFVDAVVPENHIPADWRDEAESLLWLSQPRCDGCLRGIRKKFGLKLESEKIDGERVYRIAAEEVFPCSASCGGWLISEHIRFRRLGFRQNPVG